MCFIVTVAARIDKGPLNVGAPVGSSVQLKCSFHHRTCDRMQWTRRLNQQRETETLYSDNKMYESHGGRYSVNSIRGECTLHINTLQLSDAGQFTCMEFVPGAPQVRKVAVITVIGMYLT